MSAARPGTVRCAIYTRKSSDEGLEQSFNSLDAQREACAAYILSQASEGWSALPDLYDDGGLSGGTLERPALRRLLADIAAGRITYDGQIQHVDKVFVGNHPAIIDHDVFERVQAMLAANTQGERRRERTRHPSLLAGKLVDEAGEPLIASHASKGSTRYRYYISRSLNDGTSRTGLRLPAREIESLVVARVTQLLADPVELISTAWLDLAAGQIEALHWRCRELEAQLQQRRSPTLLAIISEVRVGTGEVTVSCDTAALASAVNAARHADAPASVQLTQAARLTRTGRAMRLVQDNGAAIGDTPNAAAVKLLIKARRWWRTLRVGELNVTELAAAEQVSPAYVTRVLRLAFLSPQVTEALLKGRLRAGVDTSSLTLAGPLAASWREQAAAMLPVAIRA